MGLSDCWKESRVLEGFAVTEAQRGEVDGRKCSWRKSTRNQYRLERKIGPSSRRFPPCSLYLISSWADSETRHASTLRGKSKWKKRERKKEERKNLTRVDFYILVSKGLPVCLLKRKWIKHRRNNKNREKYYSKEDGKGRAGKKRFTLLRPFVEQINTFGKKIKKDKKTETWNDGWLVD